MRDDFLVGGWFRRRILCGIGNCVTLCLEGLRMRYEWRVSLVGGIGPPWFGCGGCDRRSVMNDG